MLHMFDSKRHFAVLHSLRRCFHMQMIIKKSLDTGAPQPADAHSKDKYNSGAQQPAVASLYAKYEPMKTL